MTIADVVYESPCHFIKSGSKDWEIYRIGATHAVKCGSWGKSLPDSLTKAIAEVARRERMPK